MNYQVVSAAEFTYPDIKEYKSSSREINLCSARGSYAGCHILLDGLRSPEIQVSATGFEGGEFYTLMPIFVESTFNIKKENYREHYPEREAPYYIYDCYRPFNGFLILTDGFGGLYLSVKVDKDAEVGFIKGSVKIKADGETVEIPVSIEVFKAIVPDTTISLINGYSIGTYYNYKGINPTPAEYADMDQKSMAMLRRARQNTMYVGGVKVTEKDNGSYDFDLSALEAVMEKYEKNGFTRFFGPSVGWRKSWHESTILINGKIPAMSFEAYKYLTQYLPKLQKMLSAHGWNDRFVLGVADEPNAPNSTEYRALCGMIKKIAPDIRLADAMSWGQNVPGGVDVCIPLNSEFEAHIDEFSYIRDQGVELWHYVCCGPRHDGYTNRFMDYPLLSSQYLFWGNYKYKLTGYLHWAAMHYQPKQNPFVSNIPTHRNTDSVGLLPPGDTHIIYPGDGEPWMSARLEAQRRGQEEFELLKLIGENDREKADKLCEAGFRKFNNVEYDINKYTALNREILKSASEL